MIKNEDTTINEKPVLPVLIETVDKDCPMARKHVPYTVERTDDEKIYTCSFCKKKYFTSRDGDLEVFKWLEEKFEKNEEEIELTVPKKRPKNRWKPRFLFRRK